MKGPALAAVTPGIGQPAVTSASRQPAVPSLAALLFRHSPKTLALTVLVGLTAGALFAGALVAVDAALRQGLRQPGVVVMALGYVGLVCVLSMTSASLTARLLLGQINALRLRLVQRLLGAQLPALESLGNARAVAVLVDEVQRVAQGVGALPVLLMNLGICGAALGFVAWTSWPLLLLLLGTLLGGLAVVAWMFSRFLPMTNAAARQRQQVIDQLQTLTSQFKELKQNEARRQAFVQGLLVPTLQRVEHSAYGVQRVIAAMDTGVKAVFLLVLLAVVVAGAEVLGLPRSQLQTAVLAFMFIVTPFSAVLESAQKLAESRQAWLRVHALTLEGEPPAGFASMQGRAQLSVELRAAAYAYRLDDGSRNFGVKNIDIKLGRGQIVALRGGNGSGKTTVAKLLCGLYAPDSGGLFIDGLPVSDLARSAYRESLVAVWTGGEAASMWFAAEGEAQGRRWWTGFGLQETLPYQCGWVDCSRLSSGQRARAALVSALTLERPFLVLDEWAANQDAEQRERFYGELLPQLRQSGVGVLLIAHDVQALQVADSVVELHHPCDVHPAGHASQAEVKRHAA